MHVVGFDVYNEIGHLKNSIAFAIVVDSLDFPIFGRHRATAAQLLIGPIRMCGACDARIAFQTENDGCHSFARGYSYTSLNLVGNTMSNEARANATHTHTQYGRTKTKNSL